MGIELLNVDCMEYMAGLPDKAFDLAIVDPPYGIGEDGGTQRTRGSKKTNGIKRGWDKQRPDKAYFDELGSVSAMIKLFGAEIISLTCSKASRGWVYWQKQMGGDFADGELAWTSFDCVLQ